MMNRPSSNESYFPSIMPFFSMEGSSQNQQRDQLWHWETNAQVFNSTPNLSNTTNTQQRLQFTPFLDYSPPFLPLNSLNIYTAQPPAIPDYYTGFVRPEEDRTGYGVTTTGLNLSQHSYYSSRETMNFNRMFWRSRGRYLFGHQPPRCQAEGCKADLSNAKRYHRRHKVCEFHSKATVVIVSGGLQQRFCQQCSRFHSLDEFDEAKKSCRKRLADHNRRRRKPQPPSSTSGSQTPSNGMNKKKPAPKRICDTTTTKCSSNSACTISSTDTMNLAAKKEHKSKATSLRIGSSLSLGGFGARDMVCMSTESRLNPQGALDIFSDKASEYQLHLPSCPSSSTYFPHQQSLSCSSSNGALQSLGGPSDQTNQHQSSLLQVGQAMFELDFV